MKEIRLYGELGKRFGRSHRLDVRTPSEALHALGCTIKGFRQWLFDHREDKFRVWVGVERRDAKGLLEPSSDREIIRVAPVVEGAGDSKGFFGILAGALLVFFAPEIGLAIGGPEALGLAAGSELISAATITNISFSVGWGLILGGVSQLLFAPPKAQEASQAEAAGSAPSFVFDGAVNTTREGNCVPIVYGGPIRVGSQVISAGLQATQI